MPSLATEAADRRGRDGQVRIWFSGPRLFNGLIRPGVSFALSELSKKPSRAKHGGDPAPAPELGKGHSPAHFAAFFRALFWFLLSLTAWGLMLYGFLALVGCVGGGAMAGTCRMYMDGVYAVTSCEEGSFTVRDRDGGGAEDLGLFPVLR